MSTRIIAEAGVNHNGSLLLAKKMIDAAKEAGADYVKFQTFKPEKLVTKTAVKAEYQEQTTGKGESQLEMLKKLTLSEAEFLELEGYAREKKIGFISTPFDDESIEFLSKLDMDFWKIPSGEVTNYPYLVALAKTGKEIILSTGMCGINEIEEALETLRMNGAGRITLLHCNTEYPTPWEDVNLRAMNHLREQFEVPVGYSDHTKGIEVSIAAVACGATVIEKHFTLDKTMEGPDHMASLEPEELKSMVTAIRNIEKAMGDGIKKPTASESKNKSIVRKSIVAACEIKKGTPFSKENLTTKRPGDGISPMRWNDLIGKVAKQDYYVDEKIANFEV